jgi:hypothetical protein
MTEWLVFYEDFSHFPTEITTLGLKCTMCAQSSLSQHAKRLTLNWAHARVALNASYTLVLKWCQSGEMAVGAAF